MPILDKSAKNEFRETLMKLKDLEIKLEKEISKKNLPEATELVSQLLRAYELKRKIVNDLNY